MNKLVHISRTLLLGFLLLLSAQTSISTSPPHLNYLSYYSDQNNHLQVIVTLLDFNTPPVMARLRVGAYAYKKIAYYVKKESDNVYILLAKKAEDDLTGWRQISNEAEVLPENSNAVLNDLNGSAKPNLTNAQKAESYSKAGTNVVDDLFSSFVHLKNLPENTRAFIASKNWDNATLTKLDNDLANDLLRAEIGNNPNLVDSWKVLDDANYSVAKLDIPTLNVFSKIDEIGEASLKAKLLSKLDDNQLVSFADDFSGAANKTFETLNANEALIDYWSSNRNVFINRTYPTPNNVDWSVTSSAIQSGGNSTDQLILQAIESQHTVQPLTNSRPVMAGAYCPELGGNVTVKYNLTNGEKAVFNYDNLEPVIKDHIDYMNLIQKDAVQGGNLYEKLYKGVSKSKIITAGDAASHAEVLALDALIKDMKSAGVYTTKADLNKISILVRGKGNWGNMCRCPHCFHLTNGVNMIGNH